MQYNQKTFMVKSLFFYSWILFILKIISSLVKLNDLLFAPAGSKKHLVCSYRGADLLLLPQGYRE